MFFFLLTEMRQRHMNPSLCIYFIIINIIQFPMLMHMNPSLWIYFIIIIIIQFPMLITSPRSERLLSPEGNGGRFPRNKSSVSRWRINHPWSIRSRGSQGRLPGLVHKSINWRKKKNCVEYINVVDQEYLDK